MRLSYYYRFVLILDILPYLLHFIEQGDEIQIIVISVQCIARLLTHFLLLEFAVFTQDLQAQESFCRADIELVLNILSGNHALFSCQFEN